MNITATALNLPWAVLAQVPSGAPSGAASAKKPDPPSIEKALDPKKPTANLETCADPRIGKEVMVNGLKGRKISFSVTVFRVPGTNQTAGYYSDYFDARTNQHIAGIFFDRTGKPIATLGLPGENIGDSRFVPIYDYQNPQVKLGYFRVITEASFPGLDPQDPPLFKLRYAVVNQKFDEVFSSDSFAAIKLRRLNSADGYALDQTDYSGAIAEIDSLGQVGRLVGVIKKFCPAKP